jgi:hypothetical protein
VSASAHSTVSAAHVGGDFPIGARKTGSSIFCRNSPSWVIAEASKLSSALMESSRASGLSDLFAWAFLLGVEVASTPVTDLIYNSSLEETHL